MNMKTCKVIFLFLVAIWTLQLSEAVKISSSDPYFEQTDILNIKLDGSVERVVRYHHFNPSDDTVEIPIAFTIDDFFYSSEAYVVDSSGHPPIIDGVEQKVKIEKIPPIFRYSFGPIVLNLNSRSASYYEFHEPISDYWNGKSFHIRQKIVAASDAKFLRVEFHIPKKPQSIFKQYSLFLTKIDPAPDTIYETPNEKVFIWNLGELSLGDFFYIELGGGYKKSWFPIKDKFFAWLIGFVMAALLRSMIVRKKKNKKQKH